MSRSIIWKPVSDKALYLGVNGASTFQSQFERVFGSLPKIVTRKDLERLEVIKALNEDEPGWQAVIDLVHQHDQIEVIVEW